VAIPILTPALYANLYIHRIYHHSFSLKEKGEPPPSGLGSPSLINTLLNYP